MGVVAFVLSLIGGLISFFQGGCGTVAGVIGSGMGDAVGGKEGAQMANEGAAMGGAGFLIIIAAILAIVGGSFALAHKKAGYILLTISAVACFIAYGVSGGIFQDAIIWGVVYLIADFCAYKSFKNTNTTAPVKQEESAN